MGCHDLRYSPIDVSVLSLTAYGVLHVVSKCGSIPLRVVTLPSGQFDGTTNVTFEATGLSPSPSMLTSSPSYADDGADEPSLSTPNQTLHDDILTSFNATFYHCVAGSFWNHSESGDDPREECIVCTAGVDGEIEVRKMDCAC